MTGEGYFLLSLALFSWVESGGRFKMRVRRPTEGSYQEALCAAAVSVSMEVSAVLILCGCVILRNTGTGVDDYLFQ